MTEVYDSGAVVYKSYWVCEWRFDSRLHRFDGKAVQFMHLPYYESSYWLFGYACSTKKQFEREVAMMARTVEWYRTRKLRRFVRLCRSKEFNELWYSEGMPGRRWDHASIMRMS